jgi:hypothetical protein
LPNFCSSKPVFVSRLNEGQPTSGSYLHSLCKPQLRDPPPPPSSQHVEFLRVVAKTCWQPKPRAQDPEVRAKAQLEAQSLVMRMLLVQVYVLLPKTPKPHFV